MKITKAVIPAAGFGTRFLPATKSVPKEMMPIVDKPAIQYVIEEAVHSGITDILIIVSKYKKSIEDYFDYNEELDNLMREKNKSNMADYLNSIANTANIHFIRQKEAKGLGHAISMAKTFVGKEPFAVLLPDDLIYAEKPCLKQMIEKYNELNSTILGVQRVQKDMVDKYGIINGKVISNDVFKVDNLIEKPQIDKAPTNIAIVGRYIISNNIFNILDKLRPGAGNEIQLTDGLLELLSIENMYGYIFEGKRYDVGNTVGYLEAVFDYALMREDLRDCLLNHIKSAIK